jgi:hypothetical protein
LGKILLNVITLAQIKKKWLLQLIVTMFVKEQLQVLEVKKEIGEIDEVQKQNN